MDNYTLLYHEILDKVHKAKSKEQKVSILRQYNTEGFRKIIKASFDPKIEWDIPEGSVPYRVNERLKELNILDLPLRQISYGTSSKVQIEISVKPKEK